MQTQKAITSTNYLTTALEAGVWDNIEGKGILSNPYPRNSLDWQCWREGWTLADHALHKDDNGVAIVRLVIVVDGYGQALGTMEALGLIQ